MKSSLPVLGKSLKDWALRPREFSSQLLAAHEDPCEEQNFAQCDLALLPWRTKKIQMWNFCFSLQSERGRTFQVWFHWGDARLYQENLAPPEVAAALTRFEMPAISPWAWLLPQVKWIGTGIWDTHWAREKERSSIEMRGGWASPREVAMTESWLDYRVEAPGIFIKRRSDTLEFYSNGIHLLIPLSALLSSFRVIPSANRYLGIWNSGTMESILEGELLLRDSLHKVKGSFTGWIEKASPTSLWQELYRHPRREGLRLDDGKGWSWFEEDGLPPLGETTNLPWNPMDKPHPPSWHTWRSWGWDLRAGPWYDRQFRGFVQNRGNLG